MVFKSDIHGECCVGFLESKPKLSMIRHVGFKPPTNQGFYEQPPSVGIQTPDQGFWKQSSNQMYHNGPHIDGVPYST